MTRLGTDKDILHGIYRATCSHSKTFFIRVSDIILRTSRHAILHRVLTVSARGLALLGVRSWQVQIEQNGNSPKAAAAHQMARA